ncbi:MAG TPA: S8/S53 family peptidase, partial [Chitinophagales bacterium]|nr:S8/S53 family peptidase [Chitinophagales bacterium]
GIERVEGYHGIGKTLDEQTDIHTNVALVKSATAPLTQAYDGDSVVVGIIDTGMDFTHPDFKDAFGATRILNIWDQTATTGGTTPSFGYGQEWNSTEIDAGTCTHTELPQYYGHGSNVSGVAVGNGLALNKYAGIATKAKIVSVAVDMGPNMLNNVADAVQYIFQRADEDGLPCAVNASVGNYSGSHDGADLPAQLIDQLITEHNGRTMAASAGNAGNVFLHLGYEVEADSAYSWFRYEPSISQVYYELWASKENFNNVWFSLGADKGSPSFEKRATTEYYNILGHFDVELNGIDSLRDTLYTASGTRMGIYTIYAVNYNDSTYQIAVSIIPDSTTYLWRLTTKGSGYFDCWAHPNYTGTSNIVKASQLPSAAAYPDVVRYRAQDYLQNIVGSFQCSDKVITVANYTNRTQFPNHYGDTTYYPNDTVGARVMSSSVGPTRDGRIKPDIAAPGGYTITTGEANTLAQFIATSNLKVAEGGLHNINGGTSMASPVVSGISALFLQKNPTAGWWEIKQGIQMTAIQDQFTGNALPDIKWGFGKIDAFALLTEITFGCTDPTALNFDSTATFDNGTCNYVSVAPIASGDITFQLYPNPASDFVFVQYKNTSTNPFATIEITDAIGRVLYSTNVKSNERLLKLDASKWSNGVFFCRLSQNSKTLRTVKFGRL